MMLFIVLALVVAAAQADEHQIRVSMPRSWQEAHRLSQLGLMFDRVPRAANGSSEMDAYASTVTLSKLREAGVAFREVAHEGKLARERSLRDRSRAITYHHHPDLLTFISDKVTRYPDLVESYSIGKSTNGLEMMVVKITNRKVTVPRPQFKWVGNMHGDETVGREMLIQLISDILERFSSGDAGVVTLLNTVEIHILPTMNPDGFELGWRGNKNGLDLNRNFPDQFGQTTGDPQVEMQNVMRWSSSKSFFLSANLHGGDLVANYPWDGNAERRSGLYSACPDDLAFRFIASTYAQNHIKMRASREFPGGITNGAFWYILYGGMQDWNYLHTSDFEITLELSFVKYPPASQLDDFWKDNKAAMYAYMNLLRDTGVRGIVSGVPGNNYQSVDIRAARKVNGQWEAIDHVIHPNPEGLYHRILAPGTYKLTFSCPGRQPKDLEVTIPNKQTSPVAGSIQLN